MPDISRAESHAMQGASDEYEDRLGIALTAAERAVFRAGWEAGREWARNHRDEIDSEDWGRFGAAIAKAVGDA